MENPFIQEGGPHSSLHGFLSGFRFVGACHTHILFSRMQYVIWNGLIVYDTFTKMYTKARARENLGGGVTLHKCTNTSTMKNGLGSIIIIALRMMRLKGDSKWEPYAEMKKLESLLLPATHCCRSSRHLTINSFLRELDKTDQLFIRVPQWMDVNLKSQETGGHQIVSLNISTDLFCKLILMMMHTWGIGIDFHRWMGENMREWDACQSFYHDIIFYYFHYHY